MSIITQAQSEMARVGFSAGEVETMTKILELFFEEWDSGGAVACMLPVLQRCVAGKPLSPLTGEDDEWMDVSYGGAPSWQNNRCSTVFKDSDGRCYDIDTPGRPTITFPYSPEKAEVRMPIFEMEV